MMEQRVTINAARAWKAARLVQVGASAAKTPMSKQQTDSSSMLLRRSNSGLISITPTAFPSPNQMNIIAICAVLDDVRTCMAGSVVVTAPKFMPCAQRFNFYRAMHFSAKRGLAIACRLSVRLSVCL